MAFTDHLTKAERQPDQGCYDGNYHASSGVEDQRVSEGRRARRCAQTIRCPKSRRESICLKQCLCATSHDRVPQSHL
jgi:hypothetical protein